MIAKGIQPGVVIFRVIWAAAIGSLMWALGSPGWAIAALVIVNDSLITIAFILLGIAEMQAVQTGLQLEEQEGLIGKQRVGI